MDWNQFTSIPNGTQVKNHLYDQCVALANLFHESVIGGTFVGVPSAFNWWTDFSSWETLRANYTQSQAPVAGAIFVARGGIYNLPDGHIGIVTKINANGTFQTMEQNAGTWRYVGRYTRGSANILGFLIPKNNPATPASKPASAQLKRRRKGRKLHLIYLNPARQDGSPAYAIYAPGVLGSWEEFDADPKGNASAKGAYANALASQFGAPMQVTLNTWKRLQKKYS